MPTLLDDVLPQWHRRERHTLPVDRPPAVALTAAEELTWRDVPAFRAILRAASLGRARLSPDARVLDMFLGAGFAVLVRDDVEVVFGAVQSFGGARQVVTPPAEDPAAWFRAFDDPGHIKVTMNFHVAAGVLATETRVLATDARARRAFAAYWFVIRGGSGLIRRSWLRGIRRRAST